jgi:VanZ family protein
VKVEGEPGAAGPSAPGLAPDRPRPARFTRAALAVAILVNLLVVFWPVPPSGASLFPHADKVAHVLVFATVAWTGRRAAVPLVVLVVLLCVHAVESELVQHVLLPARSGDAGDTIADLAGVAAGSVLPRARVAVRLVP